MQNKFLSTTHEFTTQQIIFTIAEVALVVFIAFALGAGWASHLIWQ